MVKQISMLRSNLITGLLGVLLSTQLWASDAITGIEVPPPDIDFDVITRLWSFVKKTTEAPPNLPPPPLVLDWHVPPFARMGFQYPTPQFPENLMQISIAPRTIEQYSKEMVTWGVGHELVHYAFILRENQWRRGQATFQDQLKHHCNPEFIDLTAGIAELISDAQPQARERLSMYSEIFRSCARYPDQ